MSSYNPQNSQHPAALPFSFVLPPKNINPQPAQSSRKRSREDDDGEYDIHPEYRDNHYDVHHQDASPGDMPLSLGDEDEFGGHSPVAGADADDEILKQGLNADGTPKRPMNAFMIFARRRRPEVSQDYPALRTGEISKLLSTEWTNMTADKKKTFLDLAKKLKDRFNEAHPEYVYKRRPNNSRKKRKNSNAQADRTTPGLEQQPQPIVASNGPEVMAYGGPYDDFHHRPLAHHQHPHHPHYHQARAGGSISPPHGLGINGYALDNGAGRTSRSSRLSISSQQHPYDVPADDPSHLYVVPSNNSPSVHSPHHRTPLGYPGVAQYDEPDFNYHQQPPHHPLQQQHGGHPHSSVPYAAQDQGIVLPQVHHHQQFASPSGHPHHPTLVHQASRESMTGGPRQHRADSVNSVNSALWASPARAPHWSSGADGRRTSSGASPGAHLDHPSGLVEGWVPEGPAANNAPVLEGLGLRPVPRHDSIASVTSSSVGRPGTGAGLEGTAGGAGWQAPGADLLSPLSSDPVGMGVRAPGRPHSNSVSSSVGRPGSGSGLTRPHSSSISVMPGGRALGSFGAISQQAANATGFEHLTSTPLHGTVSLGPSVSTPDLQQQATGGLARASWADWGSNQHFQGTGTASPGARAQPHEFTTLNTPYYPQGASSGPDATSNPSAQDSSVGAPTANHMVDNHQASANASGTTPGNSNNGSGFHSFQNDPHDVNFQPRRTPSIQHGDQRFSADVLGASGPASVSSLDATGDLYSTGTSVPTNASTPPTVSAPTTPDYGAPHNQSHEMIVTRSMPDVASFMASGGSASILGGAESVHHSQNYGLGAVDHRNPYESATSIEGSVHHHHHHHFAQPVLANSALHHPVGGYWESVKAEPAV